MTTPTPVRPPIYGFVPWSHDRLTTIRDTRARAWIESVVVDKPKKPRTPSSTRPTATPRIKLPSTLSPDLQAQILAALKGK